MIYPWLKRAGRIINTGRARTIVLSGNVHDLFHIGPQDAGQYVTLLEYLVSAWNIPTKVGKPGVIVVTYELNEGIDIPDALAKKSVEAAFNRFRGNQKAFDEGVHDSRKEETRALEVLRQLCLMSRSADEGKRPYLAEDLVILIEGADLLIPDGPITSLNVADRHRVAICQDWFTDRQFLNGKDTVVLVTESRSQLHQRVSRLPQIEEVEVDAPDETERLAYIKWFDAQLPPERKLKVWSTVEELAAFTGGLTIHAMRQMLIGADGETLLPGAVVDKVESFMKAQIGEDVVSFKRPTHKMSDLVGNAALLAWLAAEFIPRITSTDLEVAYAAAVVGGPIRTGKTYIFEAVAGELGIPVIELKNFRSMWLGQTDVVIERIYRTLRVISKAIVLLDEADTQFGGVGKDVHETEKRATGKFQQMMSDPSLRGRVMWLMMTARIHLLSPDLRGEGRGGDCIIVVRDPEGDDHEAFVRWMVAKSVEDELPPEVLTRIRERTKGYYAGAFKAVRAELKAQRRMKGRLLTTEEVIAVIENRVMPDIAVERRFQLLHALVNCTDRRLLPPGSTDEVREGWLREIRQLEAQGIR